MIYLHDSYVAELVYDIAISGSAVQRVTDCAVESGSLTPYENMPIQIHSSEYFTTKHHENMPI